MMHIYARIDNGVVAEIIAPAAWDDGTEIPIAQRFTAELVATMVDITSVSPLPEPGWTYDGVAFSAPARPAGTTGAL